jgi:GT2 family glycosyltransferase
MRQLQEPQVTIVVVLRERFTLTERSLSSIYKNTQCPFRLVYVVGKAPLRTLRYLKNEAEEKGFLLITTEHHISPNQARNLGLKEVKTKYVVFIDNDALVAPGWLEALVQCAEETDAWVVGPLCLIGEISAGIVHVAGGNVHFKDELGKKVLYDEQYLFNTPLREVKDRFVRKPLDYVEFHCALVRTDAFQSVGNLDEQLFSVHEHIDFCLSVKQAGGSVHWEPRSVVTYIPSPPYDWTDLPYFMLRWSEEWNSATTNRFCDKWGVSAMGWLGNKSTPVSRDLLVKFGRGHRRIMTGVKYTADQEASVSPLEQAELMVALFQSVDRDCFELRLSTREGQILESLTSSGVQEVQRRLPGFLSEAESQALGVTIRPVDRGEQDRLTLLRLDDLDALAVEQVQPSAFMILETNPKSYQCWLAMDKKQLGNGQLLVSRIGSDQRGATTDHFAPLAGIKRVAMDGLPRVRIVRGIAGLLMTARQFSNSAIQPLLEKCILQ